MPTQKLLKAFSAEPDIQTALLAGLRAVAKELPLKPVVLFELREKSGKLRPLGAEGLDRASLSRQKFSAEDTWASEVLAQQDAVPLTERESLPDPLQQIFATSENLFATPLISAGERVGLLVAGSADALDADQLEDFNAMGATFGLYMANQGLKNRLERRQILWRSLLRGIQLPVAVIDGRSRIMLWNEAMEQFTHHPARSVEEGEVWSFLPKPVAEVGRYLLQRALQRRTNLSERVRLEGQLPAHSGTRMLTVVPLAPEAGAGHTQAILIVLPDSRRDQTGGVGGVPDVSQREREFMALIQHELRTPITSIRGAVHLLGIADPEKPVGDSMGLIKIIQANTQRLENHIIDIIDVVVLTNNELTLQPESLDLRELVEAAVEGYEQKIREKKIEFSLSIDESIPAVSADADRFAQVLRHLLDNAIKFTPVGGKISIAAQESTRFVEIDLKDSGPGITSDFAPRAFERFTQQAPHLTRQQGGHGIGLYIAKGITRLHGGDLKIAETGKDGTTMRVTLPKVRAFSDDLG